MKKTIKNDWVQALESGSFEQGKNILCKNDKYCCFGVLAETLGLPRISDDKWVTYEDPGDVYCPIFSQRFLFIYYVNLA